jgi:hypothetical protein
MISISEAISARQHPMELGSMRSLHLLGSLLAGIIVLGGLPLSASAQNCPNLRGHWVSGSGGGVSLDIKQSDCTVTSDNMNSAIGFHHTLSGHWDPEQYSFILTVARLDPNHCWTHLYGRATVTGASTFNIEITSTEGRCGLSSNFRDHGTYTRQ